MTASAAQIDEEFVATLLNMSARQRWALEVAMEIRQAERERYDKVFTHDVQKMLRAGTWDRFVEDLKAEARREVMARHARIAKTATDEMATRVILKAYPQHRIKETYQIGQEVYAKLVGPGGEWLNIRYACGKVYAPQPDCALEPA